MEIFKHSSHLTTGLSAYILGNWKESCKPQEERFRYLDHENLSCWQGWTTARTPIYENKNYVEMVQGIDSKALKQQHLSHYQEWSTLPTQVAGYGNYELTFESKSPRNLKYTKCIPCQSLERKHSEDDGRKTYVSDSCGFQGLRYPVGISRKNLSLEKEQKLSDHAGNGWLEAGRHALLFEYSRKIPWPPWLDRRHHRLR